MALVAGPIPAISRRRFFIVAPALLLRDSRACPAITEASNDRQFARRQQHLRLAGLPGVPPGLDGQPDIQSRSPHAGRRRRPGVWSRHV